MGLCAGIVYVVWLWVWVVGWLGVVWVCVVLCLRVVLFCVRVLVCGVRVLVRLVCHPQGLPLFEVGSNHNVAL